MSEKELIKEPVAGKVLNASVATPGLREHKISYSRPYLIA